MSTAQEVYDRSVRPLPLSERLRLATLILQELTAAAPVLDFSDSWSDEDLRELTDHVLRHGAECYPEDQELV